MARGGEENQVSRRQELRECVEEEGAGSQGTAPEQVPAEGQGPHSCTAELCLSQHQAELFPIAAHPYNFNQQLFCGF